VSRKSGGSYGIESGLGGATLSGGVESSKDDSLLPIGWLSHIKFDINGIEFILKFGNSW
jgi:hypothetical protein